VLIISYLPLGVPNWVASTANHGRTPRDDNVEDEEEDGEEEEEAEGEEDEEEEEEAEANLEEE
jgi:hypothetical protein